MVVNIIRKSYMLLKIAHNRVALELWFNKRTEKKKRKKAINYES